uniref:Uncharacterized protein n=1 Tax=Pinctada fucata TaxID=50426 RepID=A0A194ALS3_PINFU
MSRGRGVQFFFFFCRDKKFIAFVQHNKTELSGKLHCAIYTIKAYIIETHQHPYIVHSLIIIATRNKKHLLNRLVNNLYPVLT